MRVIPLLLALLVASCVQHHLEVNPVDLRSAPPVVVNSPVKAHLEDGSTIVYPDGVRVEGGALIGMGQKFDLSLAKSERVTRQTLDAVVAMESFQTPVNKTATVLTTGIGIVGGAVLTAALMVAVFGSCPTLYTFDADQPVLEAESFSYSIAPGLEATDIDRLGVAVPGRILRMELRNEALETHYINQLELLRVVHAAGTEVYPDPRGRPVVLSALRAPSKAQDRDGRTIDDVVADVDGNAWSSTGTRLAAASAGDLEDYVEAEFDLPPGTREAGVVLRLRNSLLNTTLLYDVLLRQHGWRALDWMGARSDVRMDLEKVRLAEWYGERMGMRVEVWDGRRYRETNRFSDQGPIAWKDLVVIVPVLTDGRLKVRLTSVVDNWRIDWIAAAADVRYARPGEITAIAPAFPDQIDAGETEDAVAGIDDRYLVHYPGDTKKLEFDLGEERISESKTLMISLSGYYVEWIRREWLQEADGQPFTPSDDTLLKAISLWQTRREGYRDLFETMRVETR